MKYFNKYVPAKSFDRLYNLIVTNAIFTKESEWRVEKLDRQIICDTCTENKAVYFTIGGDVITIDNLATGAVHHYFKGNERYHRI